ncbi:CDP-glycerol glycerophosphotransferase family protein [Microbacterium trichothecenolyticum]|uniref:CDP-glycerol glycerophosphotransferase n=1 Tax=Microbacterium trichothecenolyticum TaxID=69370 RepID=A0ABU0TPN0_MICTR|nr:CDP-glycerol glycerophosphotransferase family protein [Microbacterium trichothecenolyticum]MDQ1121633.1 CDP-glycerol glycerophosphotransferase [Microbacterium trichothecenolyticum]
MRSRLPLVSAIVTSLRRRLLRFTGTALMSVLPADETTVVYGYPEAEEQSLGTALLLAERSDARVVLIATDTDVAASALSTASTILGLPTRGISIVAKRSLRGYLAFIRARHVFYTHGLWESPTPRRGRRHVNLWHGVGPKRTFNGTRRDRIGAQVLCGQVPSWTRQAAADLGMPPRTEISSFSGRRPFVRGARPRAAVFAKLGLDPRLPLVLWVPTYRASVKSTPAPASPSEGALLGDDFLAVLQASEINFVVKPHPSDRAQFTTLNADVLTTGAIWAAGVSLYELIAHVDLMISDYSSIWVDYLWTRKSLAFHLPDESAYVGGRGLKSPDFRDCAPDLVLREVGALEEALDAISSGGVWRESSLASLRTRLQVTDEGPDVATLMVTTRHGRRLRPRDAE